MPILSIWLYGALIVWYLYLGKSWGLWYFSCSVWSASYVGIILLKPKKKTLVLLLVLREKMGLEKVHVREASQIHNPIMAWGKGCGLYWNSSFYKGWIYIYKYLNGDRYHMGGESECECIKQISKNVWGCVAKLTQIILSSKRISSFLDLS